LFVDDMEEGLRQIGIGDLVVGKHVGRLVGALGGRLSAFRTALAEGSGLAGPVRRNIFRDAPPSEDAVSSVARGLLALHEILSRTSADALMAGQFGR
jgi:cytochrome b pre-mRNA-processing protein 3